MDKITGEFNEKNWENLMRASHWHTDFEQASYKAYLQAEALNDIVFCEHRVAEAQSLLIRFAIPQFFIDRGLTVEKIVSMGHDGEYAASFSNIEYEYDKRKSCLESGTYFVSSATQKFLVILEPVHEGFRFKIAAHKDAVPNCDKIMEDLIQYSKDHNFLKGKKIDAGCNFIKFERDYAWEDLILTEKLKNQIRRNLKNLISHRDIYQKNNLMIKRGLIFSGPPGCGKSTLGKILCRTIDWTFIWVTPKNMTHPRHIGAIVDLAKELAPTVLFLEDIDLYGAAREESSANPALLGELMNQLDGIQENKDIITIATTNKAEILEKALIDRPGRFDKVLNFDKPDEACRIAMLKHFSKDLRLDPDIDFKKIADATSGMAGAHIRELVNMAVLYAIDTASYDDDKIILVKKEHLEGALGTVKKKNFDRLGFSPTTSSRNRNIDDILDSFHDFDD